MNPASQGPPIVQLTVVVPSEMDMKNVASAGWLEPNRNAAAAISPNTVRFIRQPLVANRYAGQSDRGARILCSTSANHEIPCEPQQYWKALV